VLHRNVQVLPEELRQRAKRDPRRVVEARPGVLAVQDQIGNEYPGNGSMRHTITRVAGCDIHVVRVQRVSADEHDPIDGIEPRSVLILAANRTSTRLTLM
jgi:hypothetical protein